MPPFSRGGINPLLQLRRSLRHFLRLIIEISGRSAPPFSIVSFVEAAQASASDVQLWIVPYSGPR